MCLAREEKDYFGSSKSYIKFEASHLFKIYNQRKEKKRGGKLGWALFDFGRQGNTLVALL